MPRLKKLTKENKSEVFEKVFGLKPIVNSRVRILVLGSIPGVTSILNKQYYTETRNRFWSLLGSAVNTPVPKQYSRKKKMLLSNGIGVWNIIKWCYRKGSLDKDVKNPEINNIKKIIAGLPKLKVVMLNGGMAYRLYKSRMKNMQVKYEYLPSSSSRNTDKEANIKKTWIKVFNRYLTTKQ